MFAASAHAFRRHCQISVFTVVLFACTIARADLVDSFVIGQGSSSAEIQFDFSNGNSYHYELHWDGGELSGRDIFDVILKEQGSFFSFNIQAYDWGEFLTEISISNDNDSGDGSEPPYLNYWHYWTAEAGNPWEFSMIGFTDRFLSNGSRDAWVFGTEDSPATIPIPAAGFLLCTFAGLISRRRR